MNAINNNNINAVIKLQKQKSSISSIKGKSVVQHTLKFGSLFVPSAFKDISLFFRGTSKFKDALIGKPVKRILVKQSYIFLIWIHFLVKRKNTTLLNDSNSDKGSHKHSEPTNLGDKVFYPSFFIYPFRNYKTTITRAPMAHKTYSQEQFMVRFYKLSVSFYIPVPSTPKGSIIKHKNFTTLDSINKSVFFTHFLQNNIPYLGTNMLFLHKYTIAFFVKDSKFFDLKAFS